ncbi:ABC transporter permease [Deminuibacter soli]|uniref:ABC transporter permease n=1 Tax=Deminuibacter soli TaxID=2291815 RepID=UPI003743B81C
MFLWVESEYSFDSQHAKKDNLYRILEWQTYSGKTGMYSSSPGPLTEALIKERPEVVNACHFSNHQLKKFGKGPAAVLAKGVYADKPVFSMFTLPFVQGNAATALQQVNALVLTESAAKKMFGNTTNVVGKTLPCDDGQDYVVTGVIKDLSPNGTLQFEWIGNYDRYFTDNKWLASWGANGLDTYVELRPGTDVAAVNKSIYNFIQQKEEKAAAHIFLFSLGDLHMRFHFEDGKQSGGLIQYVRMFTTIAWIILLIACINFMNLATARSQKRAKEVGVRKVLGAARKTLIGQFIAEALLMSYLALILAVIVVALVLPAFETLVQKDLHLQLGNPLHSGALLAIGLVCGLVAGSYPALYLSSFNPIYVFKGLKMKGSAATVVRRVLVVMQFSVSIMLIICTIIIFQQVQHIKNRDMGMDKNNMLMVSIDKDMYKSFTRIKQDLLATGVVRDAALCDYEIVYGGNNGSGYTWDGKDPTQSVLVSTRNVSPGFFNTMSMKLQAGRDFQANTVADTANVIVNEAMIAAIGTKRPIGQIIRTDNSVYTVVGVVKNFVYGDVYGQPGPLMFFCYPEACNKLYVHPKANTSIADVIAKVKDVLQKDNPAYPFDYRFLDDYYNEFFVGENLIGHLSRIFAALAIFISCLGLLGLAAFTAERRIREIGVRKVLGASVTGITALLSAEFLQLVALSALIAFPIAWWAMHNWLQQYAYRIGISWWVFALAGVVSCFVALATVSFQAVKAALTNPIKNLRTE